MKVTKQVVTVRRVDNEWLMRELGRRLRDLLQSRGLTLQAVGDGLGVTRAAVNNWELGRSQHGFMLQRVYDIALFYKVPVTRLLP